MDVITETIHGLIEHSHVRRDPLQLTARRQVQPKQQSHNCTQISKATTPTPIVCAKWKNQHMTI